MSRVQGIADWFALVDFRSGRAEFYRDFAEMYQRNEAMVSFLEGEIGNATLTRQRSRARALRIVLHRHRDGDHASRVSHLLEGVVPRSDAMLLTAVDRAADKPQALRALADAIDKQQQMLRLMASYSVLPTITIPICYALITLLGKVILVIDDATPVYAQDALWEGMNGWARNIATFAEAWGAQTSIALAVALGAVLWSLPRWRGASRLRVEGWPIYGLYRDFQAGMLFSSMAMMLKTGETLQGSIDDVTQRASPWMRWHLGRVVDALEENPTATLDAFRRGLLSSHLLSRAATLHRAVAREKSGRNRQLRARGTLRLRGNLHGRRVDDGARQVRQLDGAFQSHDLARPVRRGASRALSLRHARRRACTHARRSARVRSPERRMSIKPIEEKSRCSVFNIAHRLARSRVATNAEMRSCSACWAS
jgi:hypothetical protein